MNAIHAKAIIEQLRARGFDRAEAYQEQSSAEYVIGVRCSQCEAMVINWVATHESGCPNATQECKGCHALIPTRPWARYCEDCRPGRCYPADDVPSVECPHCGRVYPADDVPAVCSDDCPGEEGASDEVIA